MKPVLAFFTVLLFFACNKQDITRPFFESATINGSENTVFLKDVDSLKFAFVAKDNEKLNRGKVTVVKGFASESDAPTAATDLEYENFFSLEGTSATREAVIPIPENTASGTYHLLFELGDSEENLARVKTVDFIYQGDAAQRPIWNSPNGGTDGFGFLRVERGNPLNLEADVASQNTIKSVKLTMQNQDQKVLELTERIDDGRTSEFSINEFSSSTGRAAPIIIPATTTPGFYQMFFTAVDENNQVGVLAFTVEVAF